MASENINLYRNNVIESFLKNILEINENEAKQSALSINNNLCENTLVKLVHFFDMINQTTSQKSSSCNECSGQCKRCTDK